VTTDLLNVRQGPATSYPIVCVLKKGQTVKVFGQIGDWYAIYEPGKGCVGAASSKYLKSAGTGTTVAQPTKAPAKAPVAQNPSPTAKKVQPSMAPSAVSTAPPSGVTSEEQTLLNLVNKARASAGVGPLSFDMDLMKVARLKAKDMVDKNYFSHNSPTYGSPFDMMRQFNVEFKYAGENIAGNQTVEGAFDAWMKSPGHKANILKGEFNFTGIGIVSSPTYGKILVQQFIGK